MSAGRFNVVLKVIILRVCWIWSSVLCLPSLCSALRSSEDRISGPGGFTGTNSGHADFLQTTKHIPMDEEDHHNYAAAGGKPSCGTPIDVVVEISDRIFLSTRMALLCESYLNALDSVFVVTDSFSGRFVPGSPGHAVCVSRIRVLRTAKPNLSRSIAAAQYRRAFVIDAYLGAPSVHIRSEEVSRRTWVTLTEADTWFEPALLCEYVSYLQEHRQQSFSSALIIGGAGSGSLQSAAAERKNWTAFVEREGQQVSMPYGAMTIVPLVDLNAVFSNPSGGAAAACQRRMLKMCDPQSSVDLLSTLPCLILRRLARTRYEGAAFNNDHLFMACMAEGSTAANLSISALWARPQDAAHERFSVNKFMFEYAIDDSLFAPSSSIRWNNYVGAHHVSAAWLKRVLAVGDGRHRVGAWPTVFILGNASSASKFLYEYVTEAEGSDLCRGKEVLSGEPNYYSEEPHAFEDDGLSELNETYYLQHFDGDSNAANRSRRCRRFIDSMPHYVSGAAGSGNGRQVLSEMGALNQIPPEILGAATFLISLREPIAMAASNWKCACHGNGNNARVPESQCENLELYLQTGIERETFSYRSNLERLFRAFGRARFLVLQFETLSLSREAVHEFLGFAAPRNASLQVSSSLGSLTTSHSVDAIDCSVRSSFARRIAPEVANIWNLAQEQLDPMLESPQKKVIFEPWRAPLCTHAPTYEELLEESTEEVADVSDLVTISKERSSLFDDTTIQQQSRTSKMLGITPGQLDAFDVQKWGTDAIIVAIMSDRAEGILVAASSIARHVGNTSSVHLLLVAPAETTAAVRQRLRGRLATISGFTLADATADLKRNGINPMWQWDAFNSSSHNVQRWRTAETIHTASWDNSGKHINPMNHLRFYLPHLTYFRDVRRFFFVDDDILVQKDLGALLLIQTDKPVASMCSVWEWGQKCNQFKFYQQQLNILESTVLYGRSASICQSRNEEQNCVPSGYPDFLKSLLPRAEQRAQPSWNFGASLFDVEVWRAKNMTQRYEELLRLNYQRRFFPETSLAFGLGIPYLAFAGEVSCLEDFGFHVLDGLGTVSWPVFQSTVKNEAAALQWLNSTGALHWSGGGKPWDLSGSIDPRFTSAWKSELRLVSGFTAEQEEEHRRIEKAEEEMVAKLRKKRQNEAPRAFMFLTTPRSGSEWAMSMLDQHPLLCASGEAKSPENGFPREAFMPNAVAYPNLAHGYMEDCTIKRGCTWGFFSHHVWMLSRDDEIQRRRCQEDYDAQAGNDPIAAHLPRLCEAVRLLLTRGRENSSTPLSSSTHHAEASLLVEQDSNQAVSIQHIFDLYLDAVLRHITDGNRREKEQETIESLVPCTCDPNTEVTGFKAMEDWFARPWKQDAAAWHGSFFNSDMIANEHGGDISNMKDAKLNFDFKRFQKVIHFTRWNVLERLVSLNIARNTKVWHTRTEEDHGKLHGVQVRLDPINVVNAVNYYEKRSIYTKRILSQWGPDVLEVDYDQCRSDAAACFESMTEFLGVVPLDGKSFAPTEAGLVKSLESSVERIENREEIEGALLLHGHHHLVGKSAPDSTRAIDCRNGLIGNATSIPTYSDRSQGVFICCSKSCGVCGAGEQNRGCENRPGGANLCCANQIIGKNLAVITDPLVHHSLPSTRKPHEGRLCRTSDDIGCIMWRYEENCLGNACPRFGPQVLDAEEDTDKQEVHLNDHPVLKVSTPAVIDDGRSITIEWADVGGSGVFDVYLCEKDDRESCSFVRSSIPRASSGQNHLRLHINDVIAGGKTGQFSQEPFERALKLVGDRSPVNVNEKKSVENIKEEPLAAVFAVVLMEDSKRVQHFREHILHTLPETRGTAGLHAVAAPETTAGEMRRLHMSLSTKERNWLGAVVQNLHFSDSWAGRALAGQVGVTVSHARIWDEVANSDPYEVPYALILEDDAMLLPNFNRGVLRAMVEELESGSWSTSTEHAIEDNWHVMNLYVRPEDFPDVSDDETRLVRPGGDCWSLLAYMVSHAGAVRLMALARAEPLSGPIDAMLSNWHRRGLLNVAFPTRSDLVDNGGVSGGMLPSNIEGSPTWVATTRSADEAFTTEANNASMDVLQWDDGFQPSQMLGFDVNGVPVVGMLGERIRQQKEYVVKVVDPLKKTRAYSKSITSRFEISTHEDGGREKHRGLTFAYNPSGIPTLVPTLEPSLMPTAAPSHTPSSSPTPDPTLEPTAIPTSVPTGLPSGQPTLQPTGLPSLQPTTVPSLQPTAWPSLSPSDAPTALPSLWPSPAPTGTTVPSADPTLAPTPVPTISPYPTAFPSLAPSPVPSMQPSGIPTLVPSGYPTASPTLLPTAVPTLAPTHTPTSMPSLEPSALPTLRPTLNPTAIPTLEPTRMPTLEPTLVPTELPSLLPTATPTLQPFPAPTFNPTGTTAPTTPGTARVKLSLNFNANAAPTAADSDKLKGALVQQLGIPAADIKGWVLRWTFDTSRRRLKQEQQEIPNIYNFAGEGILDEHRRLSDGTVSYIWTSDFTVVTRVANTTTGTEFAASLGVGLNSTSFKTTLAASLNTTLAVDASSLATEVSTRNPSGMPTPVPSLVPTFQPSPAPSLLPTPDPTPVECPPGKFSRILDHPSSRPARFGGARYNCTDCQAGRFNNLFGAYECTSCNPGTIADAAGASECTSCNPGTIADTAGASECTSCNPGTIADAAGASACTECSPGTIADAAGASACTECTPGKYASTTAASDCSNCAVGTYTADDGSSECANAETGSYVAVTGATETTKCLAGQYQDQEGATECNSCEAYDENEENPYYYNTAKGQAACVACKCNGLKKKKAVESCNVETGSCTCGPLFVDSGNQLQEGIKAGCDEEQDVRMAMEYAYSFFGFFLLIALPFIFNSGALAVLAAVWRKDVSIVIHRLREATHKAIQIDKRAEITAARREIDDILSKAFDNLDDDGSGEIEESELEIFFEMLGLEHTEEDISKAMAAVDLDGSGYLDFDEFRHLISFAAPMIKERKVKERERAIFQALDEDGSGNIDADELRAASKLIGISLDHVTDNMGFFDSLDFDAFAEVINQVAEKKRREAGAIARASKEAFLMTTFQKLRQNDGSFTFGSFKKSIGAIGLSLTKKERLELFEIVLPSVLPDSKDRKLKKGRCGARQRKLHDNAHTRLLTFREYRTMVAAAVLNFECDYFPMTSYKEAFMTFGDSAGQGFIDIQHLADLLRLAGRPLDDEKVAQIATDLDRGDGLLLFDDFADIMHRFLDVNAEREALEKLKDKGNLLQRELRAVFLVIVQFPILVLCYVFHSLFNMVIDVYLMAQSFYHEDSLGERVGSYVDAASRTFEALRPLPLYYLVMPLKLGFFAIQVFTVPIDLNIEGGVSCEGMQAPMYLFLNFMIISILVVIFDSSIFLFLRVSPEEFKVPRSGILARCCVPQDLARFIEQSIVQAAFSGAGRNMKTVIQLVMAKMLWNSFLPFWKGISQACEDQVPGSESVAQWATSILFWILFIPMIHLLLNTSVYGIATKKVDLKYGKKLKVREMEKYFLNPERKVAIISKEDDIPAIEQWHHIHNARIVDGYRNDGSADAAFIFFWRTFGCFSRWCSITRYFFPGWRKDIEEDEVAPQDVELFDHDPRFWQQPWQFFPYLVEQSNGSKIRGLLKYFYNLGWKMWQLVKMTVGYWDHSLIENMQIKSRSAKLSLDWINGRTKHEDMLANVGLFHALIWQILPYCVFIGKLGEAFNEAPVFVYDDTAVHSVREALRRQIILDAHGHQDEEVDIEYFINEAAVNPTVTASNNPLFDKSTHQRMMAAIVEKEDDAEVDAEIEMVIQPGGVSAAAEGKEVDYDPVIESNSNPLFRNATQQAHVYAVEDGDKDSEEDEVEYEVVMAGGAPSEAVEDAELNDIYRTYSQKCQALITNRKMADSAGSTRDHVFKITYRDTPSSTWKLEDIDSIGDDVFWHVQVTLPTGAKPVTGEGMLVWFQDDSRVDHEIKDQSILSRIKRTLGLTEVAEKPRVLLYHESAENIISHGHRLNAEEIRHFQSAEKCSLFARKLFGVPGNNLPTAKEPLFIPSCCCVLKFSTPGNTGAHFTLNACYTGETPMNFRNSKSRRAFRWTCNALEYAMKLALCVLQDRQLQLLAFGLFLIIATVQGIDEVLEDNEVEAEHREEGKTSLIHDREAWSQLARNWYYCVSKTKVYRRARSVIVRKVTEYRKARSERMKIQVERRKERAERNRQARLARDEARKERNRKARKKHNKGLSSMATTLEQHHDEEEREGEDETKDEPLAASEVEVVKEYSMKAMDREGLSEEEAHGVIDALMDGHDGHIDGKALLGVLQNWGRYKPFLGLGGHDETEAALWRSLDTDGDGNVSFEEYSTGMQEILGHICPPESTLRRMYTRSLRQANVKAYWDVNSEQFYYVTVSTGEASWEPPEREDSENANDQQLGKEYIDAMHREGVTEEQAHFLVDALTDERTGRVNVHAILGVLENWSYYKTFLGAGAHEAHDEAAIGLWHSLDTDGDSHVSFDEYRQGMRNLLGPLTPHETALRRNYVRVLRKVHEHAVSDL